DDDRERHERPRDPSNLHRGLLLFCAKSAAERPRGRSPDFRLGFACGKQPLREASLPRTFPVPSSRRVAPRRSPVASLGLAPRSQWRDRAGLAPASLFRVRTGCLPPRTTTRSVFDWAALYAARRVWAAPKVLL